MLKFVAVFAIVTMCMALGYGFIVGDISSEGALLTEMPWGVVTLIDVYIGILLFSCWVCFRESNNVIAVLWILAFISTGNLATAIYLLKAVLQSSGDMQQLLFGARKTC